MRFGISFGPFPIATFGLVAILVDLELAVNSETTNAAQSVAVVVEEFFLEQRARLVHLWWIAWTQTAVNLQVGGVVLGDLGEEVKLLLRDGVENERVNWIGDHARSLKTGLHDDFKTLGSKLLARIANHFAGVAVHDQFG